MNTLARDSDRTEDAVSSRYDEGGGAESLPNSETGCVVDAAADAADFDEDAVPDLAVSKAGTAVSASGIPRACPESKL